jgi:glycosyltransferase involved in cell wall biosynthesis
MKRPETLVVLCGDPLAAANRRPQLMQQFVNQVQRCILLCPRVEVESIEKLQSMGFEYQEIDFVNQGINPVRDATLPFRIRQKLKQLAPDHLFVFHMKPILFGGLAARSLSIKHRNFLFAGLGVLFAEGDTRQAIRQLVVRGLKLGLGGARNLFFQNPDDLQTFRSHNIVTDRDHAVILNGSGVPLDDFACDPPAIESPVHFTVVTRMLRSKGIFDFCKAARMIHQSHPNAAQFNLLGPLDHGPDGFPLEELQPWIDEGAVNYLGVTTDVRPFLQQASVMVLPSYYMEGTPRGLLEALASGRPIVTTDSRGCRETVIEGKNGFLIQPKSPHQLAETMQRFLDDRALIRTMGEESLNLAIERYDVRKVNAVMLAQMGIDKSPE